MTTPVPFARPAAILPLALALFATVLSCGGGGEQGGTCLGGPACGGTIATGRYKITSFCAGNSGTMSVAGCAAGVRVDLTGISVSGTMTFNADKSYQTDTNTGGHFTETIPASCLSMQGVTISCAQLNESAKNDPAALDDFSSVVCSGTSACTCTFTLKPGHESTSGTYATSGTTLTFSPTSGATDSGPYCATSTQLTLLSGSMATMGMPGMPTMSDDSSSIVLTKE
jgi:hypothetical protein